MNTPQYPVFFRSGNRSLKRSDDTTTVEIVIPEPRKSVPLSWQRTTYPSKERLDETVKGMTPCTEADFESYCAEFFKATDRNRAYFNEIRQIRFEKQKQNSNSNT